MTNTNQDIRENDSQDIRKLLSIAYSFRYWVLLSVVLGLVLATAYLRYTPPVYRSSEQIMLINGQGQSSKNDMQMINSLISGSGNSSNVNIDNEIFILKSTRLMQKVVENMNLNTKYFAIGRLQDSDIYTNTPIKLVFTPKEGFESTKLSIVIDQITNTSVNISELIINGVASNQKTRKVALNEAIDFSFGSVMFVKDKFKTVTEHKEILITYTGVSSYAKSLCSNLNVALAAKGSDVINISLTDLNPTRAREILDTLVFLYNEESREFNSRSIGNTIAFLNDRLRGLESELNIVENSANEYRTANDLLDIGSQSQMIITSERQYNDKLSQVGVQLSIINIIKNYVDDMKRGDYKLIPSNIGLEDVSLNGVIDQYNKLVIERDRMLDGSSESNPRVVAANNQLSTIKNNIALSIQNLEKAYNLQYQAINKQMSSNQKQITRLPTRQLTLSKINRQQQIKEPLYLLLQQKREEAYIALVAISNFARVIEPASTAVAPFSPVKSKVYAIALILSLILPLGYAFTINALRNKVMFDQDITERTSIPILGNIPKDTDTSRQDYERIVSETGRDPLTESFRILRSKFDYLNIDKNMSKALVVQISSSGPNEGKSFMSTNISLSLAYSGKKVLLIGTDLRKPTLSKYLNIAPKEGLSNFLVGKQQDIRQTIVRAKGILDVITAGPIPPNPSELLSSKRLDEAIDELRAEYDYIIVDSAPFLIVSDGIIVNRIADTVIFVVRAGVTHIGVLEALERTNRDKLFKSSFIVLNAIDPKAFSYYGARQNYEYGYGYGYGYSYGSAPWGGGGSMEDNAVEASKQPEKHIKHHTHHTEM